MKKVLAISIAVLLIALSAIPVFADDVDSPKATKSNYIIHIPDDIEGGTATFEYVTDVGDDGTQTVIIKGIPDEGYDFSNWDITGDYTPIGGTDGNEIKLVISGDITAVPKFVKSGAPATTPVPTPSKAVDDSSKSPKTGSDDTAVWFILLGSAAVLVAVGTIAKRRSVNK